MRILSLNNNITTFSTMYKSITVLCVSGIIACGIILFGPATFAQLQSADSALGKITYPIADLGSCSDKKNCETYCEQTGNMQSCIDFAKKNALLSTGDIEKSERVIKRIVAGKTPGQCKTRGECEKFCQGNVANIKACVSFAEELSILPPAELAQAKKVAQALEGGAKLPGTCTDKQLCDLYCSATDHLDECLVFAEKADILPANEIAEARKIASFLKAGTTPGACKTKQSCESYCKSEQHFDECINFAEAAGLATKEDIELAKKTGGKGPGGCTSKETCATYCNDQAHASECVQFGIEKGLISEEDKENIKNVTEKIQQGLAGIDPEAQKNVEACFENKMGAETYRKLMAKEIVPTQAIGTSIQFCFEDAMKKYAETMRAKMMQEGGGSYGGGSAPQGIPKEMMQQIPKELQQQIPKELQQQIPESIRQQIPEAAGGYQSAPTGAVSPQGGAAPAPSCGMFTNVPSCDMIPDPRGQEACRQCK
ncbi:MAG: hypothetical protein UW32_C0001G0513 [Candidatus Wolfebacteria bacterium GW2011_GWE2_44_13]|uniref:Uncharacterized protein n=1 Tax=Candidatus Wolfebacteria bacterium GW2011_GWE2_44_13 TaxID=1619017 RepID=A0A0G1H967_9BACT|nr:MAG: hypothetical protein UW32_C0001G0513 [Candidatus Wolfebacteria bacterium GW2011_GWE2_44_13]